MSNNTIKKTIKLCLLGSYNKNKEINIRAFPEGYAFIAGDDEIVLVDGYEVEVIVEGLVEQDIIIKAIETLEAKKTKLLSDNVKNVAFIDSKINQLKLLTFVG